LIKQITSFTTNTATVLGNLPPIGDGTQFTIRKDHTLGSLFGDGTTNNPLAPYIAQAASITTADIVSVLSSSGVWNQYFYQTNTLGRDGSGGWRLATNPDNRGATTLGTNRAHVRVSLGTGFAFKSGSGSKNIFLNGEYRGTRERVTLDSSKGVVIANPYPVATTLADLGIATSLKTNSVAGFADRVNVLEGGKYVQFYNNGTGFVNSTNSTTSGNGVVIPSGGAVVITGQTNREIVFAPQYLAK
jgi:hypothetical protein